MRIFTAVRHSLDPRFYYGGLWSGNFYPALRQLGHEIVESQVDLLPASRFMSIPENFTVEEHQVRDRMTDQIIEEVRKAHQQKPIELFLSYFYNAHFNPEGFDEIHRLGIPTVNFYCNSIYQFKLVSQIAPKVNFSWHPEKNARSLYLQVGANPIWVQMGADPDIYHPVPQITRQRKACFVGQRYADRDRLLAKLITSEVPLDIYGSGWVFKDSRNHSGTTSAQQESVYLQRRFSSPGGLISYARSTAQNIQQHGIVAGIDRTVCQLHYRVQSHQLDPLLASAACGYAENISHTFALYEVVLNFSNVWTDGRPGSQLIPHVRLRDFEAPMCRTCYLTGYTDEIAEFYELGKEIDTYCSPEELVDKTKFYLAHPLEAEKLRQLGYQRTRRNHTWTHRFKELFCKIALDT